MCVCVILIGVSHISMQTPEFDTLFSLKFCNWNFELYTRITTKFHLEKYQCADAQIEIPIKGR